MFRVYLLWALGVLLVFALPIAIRASGGEWFVEYTATDKFPEEEGVFTRHKGYGGAVRTLKAGILTLDTLSDPNIYDFYRHIRLGELDPNGPDELLIMEWRLLTEKVEGQYGPNFVVAGDRDGIISFHFSEVRITSGFDDTLNVPIERNRFHWCRMETDDMVAYRFFVDGVRAHEGFLWRPGFGESRVGWGEPVVGYAALAHFDFFRAGVVRKHALGDLNCDRSVDFGDISPFVSALGSPEEYMNQYPKCDWKNADCNGDGRVDFGDINPFVELLTKGTLKF